jgi:hypothetical protein
MFPSPMSPSMPSSENEISFSFFVTVFFAASVTSFFLSPYVSIDDVTIDAEF